MNAIEKLNALYKKKAALEVVRLEKEKLIDGVLTPEIRKQIADIEAEFSDKTMAVTADIQALEGEIKQEVVSGGETVKGDYLMAVFAKGRVSWDTKALDGYVAAHPEVAQFRKVGEPSVSIRAL